MVNLRLLVEDGLPITVILSLNHFESVNSFSVDTTCLSLWLTLCDYAGISSLMSWGDSSCVLADHKQSLSGIMIDISNKVLVFNYMANNSSLNCCSVIQIKFFFYFAMHCYVLYVLTRKDFCSIDAYLILSPWHCRLDHNFNMPAFPNFWNKSCLMAWPWLISLLANSGITAMFKNMHVPWEHTL